MVSDLVCVLEQANVAKATCVGYVHHTSPRLCIHHGLDTIGELKFAMKLPVSGQIFLRLLWAFVYPCVYHLFITLASLPAYIQYLPYNGPFLGIEQLTPMLPKLSYNLYFEHNTGEAIKELNKDPRRTLRGTLRSVDSPPPDKFLQQTDSFLHGWANVDPVSTMINLCQV